MELVRLSLFYFSLQNLLPAPVPYLRFGSLGRWGAAMTRGRSFTTHFCTYLKCECSHTAQRRKTGREALMTSECPSTSLFSDAGGGGCCLCNPHQLQWCCDSLMLRTVLCFSGRSAIFYVKCLKECLKQVSACGGYNTGGAAVQGTQRQRA